MKKRFLLICLLALPFAMQAQGILFGLDAGYGVPLGDFSDASKGGVGGELRARFYPKDNFMVGINAGYYYYAMKDAAGLDNLKGGTSFIPVTAGFEYFFFTTVVKPYVGVDAGLYNSSFKQTYNQVINATKTEVEVSGSESNFGVAPNVGVMIGAGGTNLNACIKYVNVFGDGSTSSMLLYQLGIAFKIGL